MKSTLSTILVFVICASLSNSYAQSDSILYSFFIAGHTYGTVGINNTGLHPPFVEKFQYIQDREEIKFGILTGDIVSPGPIAQDWDEVDEDIISLGLPIYFAVGNHDMENRPLFESRYGDTYFYFVYENDLFIILDPNLDEWNISGDQLEFLENVVDSNYQTVENIFVFFHQLLWWDEDNYYSEVIPNSFAGRSDTVNFWTTIEPMFSMIPNQVVFCMGDMGAVSWSDDFTYDNYANITFIGSGMGEGPGDNFVVINVDTDKSINYDLICLNDTNLFCFGELTDYQITLDVASNEWNKSSVNLYPNPAFDYVTIAFPRDQNTVIKLISINGQLLFEEANINSESFKLNISEYPSGFYVISVTNKSISVNIKLVVK